MTELDLPRSLPDESAPGLERRDDWESWLRVEADPGVEHAYDTVDRDLEKLDMTLVRKPLEAGVVWRLRLPRGEQIEAWEPGTSGLSPPDDVARLIEDVVAEKVLVPMPPASRDAGTIRLREMMEEQRRALVAHDPGARIGVDPENLHQHRVAARRARAFLRATRKYVEPAWRELLEEPLRTLGSATGPVRDLDVTLEHVRGEAATLDEADRAGMDTLLASLELELARARTMLLDAFDGSSYRALLMRFRLPVRLSPGVDKVPLERLARRELRRLVAALDELGSRPSNDAMHGLRIRLKRVRYAAELAAPRGKPGRRFLESARALQDLLGEHQDAAIAEQRLRDMTATDSVTAAAFVAGRLAERQRMRRDHVAQRLPAAWRRLRKAGARLH